ncbi:MAG: repressor LexA [Planctomycetaceae bacterium]
MPPATKPRALTDRQIQIFEFLKENIQTKGYVPTVREICDRFDIRSPNGVVSHLKALERKGLIQRGANKSRAITLKNAARSRALPLIETHTAGQVQTTGLSNDELVAFDSLFQGTDRACLRIGTSRFSRLGILNGDYIIIDRSGNGCRTGLFAVLTSSHELSVYQSEPHGLVSAVPETTGGEPVSQVLGCVVAVVRSLRGELKTAGPNVTSFDAPK